ncbi:MAG: hypothetical protein KIS94_04615 [Chitinophagales bacterium]|nr:hypothetical protein [Chitinophagales bacterium]
MQVGVVVYYQLNKAYITQKLCENKNNAKLNCNGHCYLSKQLKKAEEGEKKQAKNLVKEKDEIVSNGKSWRVGFSFPLIVLDKFSPYCTSLPFSDYRADLVKPPAA